MKHDKIVLHAWHDLKDAMREQRWAELEAAGWACVCVGLNTFALSDPDNVWEFDTRDQAIDYALQLAAKESE